MWSDRWTDMKNLIVAFCNLANAPKKLSYSDTPSLEYENFNDTNQLANK